MERIVFWEEFSTLHGAGALRTIQAEKLGLLNPSLPIPWGPPKVAKRWEETNHRRNTNGQTLLLREVHIDASQFSPSVALS